MLYKSSRVLSFAFTASPIATSSSILFLPFPLDSTRYLEF